MFQTGDTHVAGVLKTNSFPHSPAESGNGDSPAPSPLRKTDDGETLIINSGGSISIRSETSDSGGLILRVGIRWNLTHLCATSPLRANS